MVPGCCSRTASGIGLLPELLRTAVREEMDDDAFAAEAEAQAAAGIEAEADDSFEDDDDMSDNSDISSLLGNDDEAGYEV